MQSFDVGFASLPETEKFGKSKRPNSRWALCCTPAADDAHSTQCRCCKFCLMVSCCRAFVLWTSSLIRAKHEARMWLLSLEMEGLQAQRVWGFGFQARSLVKQESGRYRLRVGWRQIKAQGVGRAWVLPLC